MCFYFYELTICNLKQVRNTNVNTTKLHEI